MTRFFKLHKKAVIITASIAVAAMLAFVAAMVLLKFIQRSEKAFLELSSAFSTYSSSQSEAAPPTVEEEPEVGLVITSKQRYTTTESIAVITGTSDAAEPLLMNGNEVVRNSDGSFAVEVNLNAGNNVFNFSHKGKTVACNINYHYVVINAYYPYEKLSLESGSTFSVIVAARPGSTATATFNGQTISLNRVYAETDEGAEFVNYTGSFKLPTGNESAIDMGKVKFTAKYNNVSEVYSSPNITCLADQTVSGMSYIAEVVAHAAETFNGATADDLSSPLNSYLPNGTVDYCDSGLIYDAESENYYYKLRCGLRVYVDKKNAPDKNRTQVTKRYKGTLPDHNEIGVASFTEGERHSVLTLNTMWRAPFQVDLMPQNYSNPAKQDYLISAQTYTYIDIKFFYATAFSGEISIPSDHSVFSWAQVLNNNDGSHTLRLHLKNTGRFYGWECEYNAAGQLCFYFLKPKYTETASNKYGIDLNGAKILIDVGHGGIDVGASRFDAAHPESERNLNLAYKIKAELESVGATVVMTRTGNIAVTADDRCRILRNEKPDYCIAIHHDSNRSEVPSGFGSFYFGPTSHNAASFVLQQTRNAGIYSSTSLKWHYFYTARMTTCPVVLTENGFMSNRNDYFGGIMSDSVNQRKAEAITRGIVDYFNDIRPFATPPAPPHEPTVSEPPVESVPEPPVEDRQEESSGATE